MVVAVTFISQHLSTPQFTGVVRPLLDVFSMAVSMIMWLLKSFEEYSQWKSLKHFRTTCWKEWEVWKHFVSIVTLSENVHNDQLWLTGELWPISPLFASPCRSLRVSTMRHTLTGTPNPSLRPPSPPSGPYRWPSSPSGASSAPSPWVCLSTAWAGKQWLHVPSYERLPK